MSMAPEQQVALLERLVGRWSTEATHPALPSVTVHGEARIEWLEGNRFVIVRATTDHPDFPDSISILGFTDSDRVSGPGDIAAVGPQMKMHYYDSRGVFRECETGIDEKTWRISRLAPGFSQRFTGSFSDDGDTIVGLWEMCTDAVHWTDDLAITYRRTS
jgi:hypothetical protein